MGEFGHDDDPVARCALTCGVRLAPQLLRAPAVGRRSLIAAGPGIMAASLIAHAVVAQAPSDFAEVEGGAKESASTRLMTSSDMARLSRGRASRALGARPRDFPPCAAGTRRGS